MIRCTLQSLASERADQERRRSNRVIRQRIDRARRDFRAWRLGFWPGARLILGYWLVGTAVAVGVVLS